MKIVIFFIALLALSTVTIATVVTASELLLSVPISQKLEGISMVNSGGAPQYGDPIDGTGGGGG